MDHGYKIGDKMMFIDGDHPPEFGVITEIEDGWCNIEWGSKDLITTTEMLPFEDDMGVFPAQPYLNELKLKKALGL